MEVERTYCVKPAIVVAISCVAITAGGHAWLGTPKSSTILIIYAATTRITRTFFGSCIVPFMTNVVRDHKCIEFEDTRQAVAITIVYKVFYGLMDIVDVLLVLTLDWRVYLTVIICDAGVSVAATCRYMNAKQRAADVERGECTLR